MNQKHDKVDNYYTLCSWMMKGSGMTLLTFECLNYYYFYTKGPVLMKYNLRSVDGWQNINECKCGVGTYSDLW